MKKLIFIIIFLGLGAYGYHFFKPNKPKIDLERKIIFNYNKNSKSLLGILSEKYGSDKGEITETGHSHSWPAHSYTDLYSILFAQNRSSVTKFFECGIGTNNTKLPSNMGENGKPGASLRMWRDYFPNAVVIGADIDKEILFQEERIRTYYLDQTDPKSVSNFWSEVKLKDFDIMLDDGLHTYEAGITLFENSIHQLAKNGLYIIEDVKIKDMLKYKDYFRKNNNYEVLYVNLIKTKMGKDNNLVIIKTL